MEIRTGGGRWAAGASRACARRLAGIQTRAERMLNRVLLRRALAGVLDGDPKPAAVITTVPITADLAASFPGVRWIYYCVDDFAEWPGLDGDTLRR